MGAFGTTVWWRFGFKIFTGDAESARYLLSGLGQSLAAIFALFFTISLILFQIIAGKYTPRVVLDYFLDLKSVVLSLIFVILIFTPFVILGRIYGVDQFTHFTLFFINAYIISSGMLLFFLVPYTYFELRRKISIEGIVKRVTGSIISKIREKEDSEAYKKTEDLLDITKGAIKLDEGSTFRGCVKGWIEILKEKGPSGDRPTGVYYKYRKGFLPLFKTENKGLIEEGISEIVDNVRIPLYRKFDNESIKRVKSSIDMLSWVHGEISSIYPDLAENIVNEFRKIYEEKKHDETLPYEVRRKLKKNFLKYTKQQSL